VAGNREVRRDVERVAEALLKRRTLHADAIGRLLFGPGVRPLDQTGGVVTTGAAAFVPASEGSITQALVAWMKRRK